MDEQKPIQLYETMAAAVEIGATAPSSADRNSAKRKRGLDDEEATSATANADAKEGTPLKWTNEIRFAPESLTDVTLVVEDTGFKLHKAILARCSQYFETVFTRDRDVTALTLKFPTTTATMKTFINALYFRPVITVDDAIELLECAHYFDMKLLEEDCCKVLRGLPYDHARLPELYQMVCQRNITILINAWTASMVRWVINNVNTPEFSVEWDRLSSHSHLRLVRHMVIEGLPYDSAAVIKQLKKVDLVAGPVKPGEWVKAIWPGNAAKEGSERLFHAIVLALPTIGNPWYTLRYLDGDISSNQVNVVHRLTS